MDPNTMLSFRKKLMSQSRKNLRTDGKTDGEILFYRTLPAKTRGTKTELNEDKILKKNNLLLKSCIPTSWKFIEK